MPITHRIRNNPSFTKFSQSYVNKKSQSLRANSTAKAKWNMIVPKSGNSILVATNKMKQSILHDRSLLLDIHF